jgi:hypothetical protein
MENSAAGKSKAEASVPSIKIGQTRPPLPLTDLPTPEEVFNKPKIGGKELITCVLGPSMIALGVSIGSGEWLLGPLAFGRFGFMGLGWLITLSAVFQTFYNVENARYTLATGEVPIVGFTRTPPGVNFWVITTLICIFMSNLWGGWATTAGQGLFTLVTGRQLDIKSPGELEIVRLIAIGLMVLSLGIYLIGKKISRTLELIDTTLIFLILGTLVILAVIYAPASLWTTMLASTVTPGAPPKGIDATTLGSIIGYTGCASGLNFYLINYYRDHGYGMGSKVGFFSGIFGGQKQDVLPSGVTFPESEKNTKLWNRWFRYLLLDQWVVFFIGAMIGMFIPSVLCVALTKLPGAAVPTVANIPVYVAVEMSKISTAFFPFILLLGSLILFKTQYSILEIMVRNTTDAVNAVSPRLRAWTAGDPRKAYYSMAIILIIVIGILIHLALPTELLRISGNMANFASLIFPLVLIYLNLKLPKPARARWWSIVVLLANVAFFGFFFINFLSLKMTGQPVVTF